MGLLMPGPPGSCCVLRQEQGNDQREKVRGAKRKRDGRRRGGRTCLQRGGFAIIKGILSVSIERKIIEFNL